MSKKVLNTDPLLKCVEKEIGDALFKIIKENGEHILEICYKDYINQIHINFVEAIVSSIQKSGFNAEHIIAESKIIVTW